MKATNISKIYLIVDLIVGFVLFGVGAYTMLGSSSSDTTFAGVLIFCALCFLCSSAGFALHHFWMVLLFSLPVIGFATFLGVMFLIGGWILGPDQIVTMYTFIFLAGLCIVLQLFGIVAAYKANKSIRTNEN